MVTSKIKELEALRSKAAELEKQVELERAQALAELPAEYGFDTAEAFIAAVRAAAKPPRGRSLVSRVPAKAKRAGRRTRAVITDETRAQVKKLVGEGKPGAVIAQALGISLPSVQNIKKALGLVQPRKKKK